MKEVSAKRRRHRRALKGGQRSDEGSPRFEGFGTYVCQIRAFKPCKGVLLKEGPSAGPRRALKQQLAAARF